MARVTRKHQKEEIWEDHEHDEVDQFHENQEKILLEQSGGLPKARDELEFSDEEVLGISEEESDEELDDAALYGMKGDDLNEDRDEEGWGSSKKNYYGADEIQDGEAAKEEEAEALRLQKKHLSELNIEDFYDEDDLEEWTKTAQNGESATINTALPDQDPSVLSKEERRFLLQASYPEVGPLSEELLSLEPKLQALKKSSEDSRIGAIQFAALSTYVGTIYAYFALFVGKMEKGRVDLKNHSVMEGILKARELWRVSQQIDDSKGSKDQEEDLEVSEAFEETVGSLSAEDSISEFSEEEEFDAPAVKRKRVTIDDGDEFALMRPKSIKVTKEKTKRADDDEQEIDLEEKEARKRSLRFYTSKIDQRSNRMNQNAYGGDDDLPYKEREFERRKRLLEEARQRGLKSSLPDEADNFGSDDEEAEPADEVEDYYDQAKNKSSAKKESRKHAHLEATKAAKEGRLAELNDQLEEGGKRAINYQILKNKGLTPHRNKDNRNPRVKKRKKYDAAKKKLKSVRAVYQAPTSSYGGESTGIKKNVVKSVHFKS